MDSFEIDRPIIIVGTGRSGSTFLHELMSLHPRLAWISGVAGRVPRSSHVNHLLMRAIDVPGVRSLLPRRIRPSEHYHFWEENARGFTAPCRDLRAADVTPKQKRELRAAFAGALTPQRPRLVLKVTGWPRLGFLQEVFPEAKFVHIVRDGRAVASSLVSMDFWRGWEGPTGWSFGPLSDEQQELWERYDRSFCALAALEWDLLLNAMREASNAVPADQFMELRYEDLCADPTLSIRRVAQFAELEWTSGYEAALRERPAKDSNYKWKQDLTEGQQQTISEITAPWRQRYGYV